MLIFLNQEYVIVLTTNNFEFKINILPLRH